VGQDPINVFDLDGRCFLHCGWKGPSTPKWTKPFEWAGRQVERGTRHVYNHTVLSAGFCAFKCATLTFQGGHFAIAGGQYGLATPGGGVGWAHRDWNHRQRYADGGGAGAAYGAAGSIGYDGHRHHRDDWEADFEIRPGGVWGGRSRNFHTWSPRWMRW